MRSHMQGQRMPTSGSALQKQKLAKTERTATPGQTHRVQADPGATSQGASHPGQRTPSVQPRHPSWGSTRFLALSM
eukprot:7597345-Alexandrium_andersonii.AAC.1